MFEDSLIESGGKLKTKRGLTTTVAFRVSRRFDRGHGTDSIAIYRSSSQGAVTDVA